MLFINLNEVDDARYITAKIAETRQSKLFYRD